MSRFLPPLQPLTMTMAGGRPYKRSPDVESEIVETLGWPDSELLDQQKRLLNETLVYHIRRFRQCDDDMCGQLLRELAARATRLVKAAVRGLEPLDMADIAIQVEIEVLELVLAPTPTRQSEFLEVAFTQAVKRRAISLRRRFHATVQGHRGRYKPWLDLDEQDNQKKRPLEFAPDTRDGPETALAAFQDEQFREHAYETVRAALEAEDGRMLVAFRLHVVDGWPLWSANPKLPTIARHFGVTHGQAKYLFEKIRKIIADVLTANRAEKSMTATGVQR